MLAEQQTFAALSEDPAGTQAAAGMKQLEQVQERDLRSQKPEALIHTHRAFVKARTGVI